MRTKEKRQCFVGGLVVIALLGIILMQAIQSVSDLVEFEKQQVSQIHQIESVMRLPNGEYVTKLVQG